LSKNLSFAVVLSGLFWLAGAILLTGGATRAPAQESSPPKSYPTIGKIERLSDDFDSLVPADAALEVIGNGLTWCEGPVWVPADKANAVDLPAEDQLLFSDIPRNTIFRWTEKRGLETFMNPSGYTGVTYYGLEPGTNGLTLDPQGRLTMCEHGDRRISVLTTGGGKLTLVDRYDGKRLNSPNDLVFAADGTMYFTDPPYGLPDRADDPMRELDFCGVYRLSVDGVLTVLTKEIDRPNGIGLSPDERTLYVAQSDPSRPIWMAYPIGEGGALGERKVLMDASKFMNEFPGLPDGLAVHRSGTIFGSGPGGIYVISSDGTLLGRIITGGRTSNCTFDEDQSTLYITADDKVCRLKLKP